MSLSVHGSTATAPPPAPSPKSAPSPAARPTPLVHADSVTLSPAAQKANSK